MKLTNLKKCNMLLAVLFFAGTLALNAQWTPQKTALPQDIQGVYAFSAVDVNTVWAIPYSYAACNKLVKTTDGGKTWNIVTVTGGEGLAFAGIHALDENNIWVAMWPSGLSTDSAIFYSSDGGETWVQQETAFCKTCGYISFVYFFNEKDGVAVGDPNGGQFEIYYTQDGGEKWVATSGKRIPMPGMVETPVASNFEVFDNTIWFGTTEGRVFRSTDKGITWETSETLWPETTVSVAFQDKDTGLALSGKKPGLMKTTDGGVTWQAMEAAPPISGLIEFVPGSIDSYVIAGSGKEGAGEGSAYTLDGGKTWVMVDEIPHNSAVFITPEVGFIGSGTTKLYKWTGKVLEETPSTDDGKKVIN
ncbi:MAG: hypothetical protein DWQ02_19180 [Bacteroidetes bacterium]|nr:MAG: hypothetical protein DWQ02_19180 [Bacteroidota bacterium]